MSRRPRQKRKTKKKAAQEANNEKQGKNVVITVSDEGPGIEKDKLKTIFARFYTYRPSEHGSRGSNSGIGLSISNEIIQAHGGTLWAENRGEPDIVGTDGKGAGACFVISLPAEKQEL